MKRISILLILSTLSATGIYAMKRSADQAFAGDAKIQSASVHSDAKKQRVILHIARNIAEEKRKDTFRPIHTVNKPFTCNVCNKSFRLKHHLNNHTFTHTKEKTFTCNVCNKSFSRKYDMTKHKKTVHDKVKNYACKVCNKLFTQHGALKNHILIHKGEKPFKCLICSQSFRQKVALNGHMLQHSKTRPRFTCEICNKSYATKKSLADHKKLKHIAIQVNENIKQPMAPVILTDFNVNLDNNIYTAKTDTSLFDYEPSLPEESFNLYGDSGLLSEIDYSIESLNLHVNLDNLDFENIGF